MKLQIEQHKKKHPHDIRKAQVIAFVVSRGAIVSVGYNRKRMFSADGRMSQHAEEAALKKAGRRARGAALYIVRIKKNDTRGLAYPCVRCHSMINRSGIDKVFFSLERTDAWGKLLWKGNQWLLVW